MVKTGKTKRKDNSNRPVLKLVLSIATVIMLAYILSFYFFRLDLTSEKRFTISPYSKKVLKNLKDIIYVKVYLDGDLNIPFQKMKENIRETLDEFKVYAGDNLEYEFVNPLKSDEPKVREQVINELYNKGLQPANILSKEKEGGSSEKIIFPSALVTYRGTEIPINLLKNNPGVNAEENINNSVQSLEFEFMRIISSLSADTTEKVAFLEGQGELDEYETGDITRELSWYYQVDRGKIGGKPGILNQYKAVIIAKPSLPFNEKDKFVLDQYIMQGGKVLWFIDQVHASFDSLTKSSSTIALINNLNLDDLLFRYGVRINPELVQDVQCNLIPVNVALAGNSADFKPAPWLYSPLLTAPPTHPITRNLNLIKTEFPCNIDTIAARKSIKKTILLRSSEYSRFVMAPVMINLDEIRNTPKQEDFNVPYQPIAVLLEGKFESAFVNRPVNKMFPDTTLKVKEESVPTAMLVVSDGDMIRNDVRYTPQGVMISPLGYDRYTQRTYGNKDFIVNCMNFITGKASLINLRSREIKLRLLDKEKIKDNRTEWMLINTIVPPLLIIIAGIIYNLLRKRKFAKVAE